MSNLTKDQLTNLVNEFVSFQINEMTQEDIYQYLRDIMRQEINVKEIIYLYRKVLRNRLMSMMRTCMKYLRTM